MSLYKNPHSSAPPFPFGSAFSSRRARRFPAQSPSPRQTPVNFRHPWPLPSQTSPCPPTSVRSGSRCAAHPLRALNFMCCTISSVSISGAFILYHVAQVIAQNVGQFRIVLFGLALLLTQLVFAQFLQGLQGHQVRRYGRGFGYGKG